MIKDDFMKHREYLGKTTSGDVDYHEYINTVNNTIEFPVISEDSIRGIERFIKELEMNACRLKEKNTVIGNDYSGRQGIVVYNALVKAFGKVLLNCYDACIGRRCC